MHIVACLLIADLSDYCVSSLLYVKFSQTIVGSDQTTRAPLLF